MKTKKLPDLNFLQEHFDYDPTTGELRKRNEYGDLESVGWTDKSGYKHVRIKKKIYKVHRIVFYMYHRRDPGKKCIDHIDGDKGNNIIWNLRAVTHKQNTRNTSKKRERGIWPKTEPGAINALFA